MRISDLIFKLQQIQAEEGNLTVTRYDYSGAHDLLDCQVQVKFRQILNARERRPRYWFDSEQPERKGEKVLAI